MNKPLGWVALGKDRDRGDLAGNRGWGQGHQHAEAGFLGCSPWLLTSPCWGGGTQAEMKRMAHAALREA